MKVCLFNYLIIPLKCITLLFVLLFFHMIMSSFYHFVVFNLLSLCFKLTASTPWTSHVQVLQNNRLMTTSMTRRKAMASLVRVGVTISWELNCEKLYLNLCIKLPYFAGFGPSGHDGL